MTNKTRKLRKVMEHSNASKREGVSRLKEKSVKNKKG